MFSKSQQLLRNQVAEMRSLLPEFDEEDRDAVLEGIQVLVSKFKYTFPEDIWKIVKEYLIDYTGFEWLYRCPKLYEILPTDNLNVSGIASKAIYLQNYKPLRNVVMSDLKVGMLFVSSSWDLCVITKIARKYLYYTCSGLFGFGKHTLNIKSYVKRISETRINKIEFHCCEMDGIITQEFNNGDYKMEINAFVERTNRFIDPSIPLFTIIGLEQIDRTERYSSLVDYGVSNERFSLKIK